MINEIYKAYKKIDINADWLYHWILDEEMLYSVYKYGILSKENLRKNKIEFLRDNPSNVGCNGEHYISVCKKMQEDSFAYRRFIQFNMAFIINSNIEYINSIKNEIEIERNKLIKMIFGPKKKIIDERIVNNRDEYLVKDVIPFNSIIGLKLPYLYDEDEILMLINFLDTINTNLPIIDVERECELEKSKVLKLIK